MTMVAPRVLLLVLLTAASAAAQASSGQAPAVDADTPLQCWWRSDTGAMRVGEVVDVTLTCAVLERDDVRAVADESRLTVAAIQMAPFEIVGGSHPPDLRADGRRIFAYRYALRLIDADAIGRDVKLPPLMIPYRVESRVSAGAPMAGRDQVHLMPQLAFRIVSQVPADAEDIRDAGNADLGRIDALRLRASTVRVAAVVLAALALVLGLSAVAPLLTRRRGMVFTRRQTLSDSTIAADASRRLGALLDASPTGELDADQAAEAHHLVRIVTGLVLDQGVRQSPLAHGAAVPEGRLGVSARLSRRRAAVTSSITTDTIAAAMAKASPPAAVRLHALRDALTTMTSARYRQDPAADTDAVRAALASTRDLAATLARERRFAAWRPSPGRASAPAAMSL